MHTHAHTGHAHVHAHGSAHGSGGRRLLWSILLNLLITVAEFVGGLLSGSLALLSDALHNFSDTASLTISYVARRIGGRTANSQKTFGYRRAEIIGAFLNLTTLILIALYLMKEAVERFLNPQPVDGPVMLIVASIGLLANLLTAVLLYRNADENLNFRSAFLHIVSDAVSSVGVVIGGLLILRYQIYFIDPVLTLAIALYILVQSYQMLRQTVDILMESTPSDVDLDTVVAAVQRLDGVLDMHHVHVWQIDEQHRALEAHIVIRRTDLEQLEEIKSTVKDCLATTFHIEHSTLEFELIPCQSEDSPHAHCYEQHAVTVVPPEPA